MHGIRLWAIDQLAAGRPEAYRRVVHRPKSLKCEQYQLLRGPEYVWSTSDKLTFSPPSHVFSSSYSISSICIVKLHFSNEYIELAFAK